MEVGGQHPTPTSLLPEQPQDTLNREKGRPHCWSGHFGEEKKYLCPYWDSNRRPSNP